MRARSTILLPALALAACSPGGPPAPAGMMYALPDPAAVTYVSGDTIRMDIDAGGQSMQARITTAGTYGATFTRVEDGLQVSLAVEEFSGRLTQPMGGPVTADESMITGPLIFTLDRRGNPSRLTPPEVTGNAEQFVQPLAISHTFFPRLPGGAVSEGHSWQDTIRYEGSTSGGQEVSSVSMVTYSVVGDTTVAGRNLVHVVMDGTTEQTSRGSIAGQSFQQSFRGDIEGFYLWDMQRSLSTLSVVDIDGRGTMNVAIAPIPLGLRLRARTTTALQEGM